MYTLTNVSKHSLDRQDRQMRILPEKFKLVREPEVGGKFINGHRAYNRVK
jgi:hypothetical protein